MKNSGLLFCFMIISLFCCKSFYGNVYPQNKTVIVIEKMSEFHISKIACKHHSLFSFDGFDVNNDEESHCNNIKNSDKKDNLSAINVPTYLVNKQLTFYLSNNLLIPNVVNTANFSSENCPIYIMQSNIRI